MKWLDLNWNVENTHIVLKTLEKSRVFSTMLLSKLLKNILYKSFSVLLINLYECFASQKQMVIISRLNKYHHFLLLDYI